MTFTNPGMIFMMFWGLLMGALYLGLFMGSSSWASCFIRR